MSADWKSSLLESKSGTPKPILANAITALREAPAWLGVLAYDEFARETIIRSAPPWDPQLEKWGQRAWTPHDDLLTTEWLQREDISVNSAESHVSISGVSEMKYGYARVSSKAQDYTAQVEALKAVPVRRTVRD